MAANISLVFLGLVVCIIGGYVIKKTPTGRTGFLAWIVFFLGIYLELAGAGLWSSFL